MLIITKIIIGIVSGILLGRGSIFIFNNMPIKWFSEQGEQSKISPKYISNTPWGYIFTAYFGAAGIYLGITESIYFQIATIFLLFILLEMAIGDILYMIIPNQLQIMLIITGIGFILEHENYLDPIYGAAAGFVIGMLIHLTGKIFYKKEAIGGGDIKLLIGIGICLGIKGIISIFLLSVIFQLLHIIYLTLFKHEKINKHRPYVPYAFCATNIYILFLSNVNFNLLI